MESPYAQCNVMVEASVLRLDLEAYYGLGISPLGETAPRVVMKKLVPYVTDHPRAVIAGIKVQPKMQSTHESVEQRTLYIPRKKNGQTHFEAYASGKSFSVTADIRADGTIVAEYHWEYSWFEREKGWTEAPPTTYVWEWSGELHLDAGQPIVAGAHTDDQHVVLLVLTAHIQE